MVLMMGFDIILIDATNIGVFMCDVIRTRQVFFGVIYHIVANAHCMGGDERKPAYVSPYFTKTSIFAKNFWVGWIRCHAQYDGNNLV